MKTWLQGLLVIGLLLAAGCQAAPAATPRPAVVVLSIQYTPVVRSLLPRLHDCAGELKGAGVVVEERLSSRLDLTQTDLVLRFGESLEASLTPSLLGLQDVVMIASLDANINEISLLQLQSLYQKERPAGAGELQALTYPAGDDLRAVFDQVLMQGKVVSGSLPVAADSAAMLELVAKSPQAVGFILKGDLTESVKRVAIIPAEAEIKNQPVLALSRGEPQGALHELVVCLQK